MERRIPSSILCTILLTTVFAAAITSLTVSGQNIRSTGKADSAHIVSLDAMLDHVDAVVGRMEERDGDCGHPERSEGSTSSRSASSMSGYVGTIPLTAGVSPSGARTYSIPIMTVDVPGGAPAVSLEYNSQGSHGSAAGLSFSTTRAYSDTTSNGPVGSLRSLTFKLGGTTLAKENYTYAYDAPVVLTRSGSSGSWTAHSVGRDILGSVTSVQSASGAIEEQRSYDPWGRARDPQTLVPYSAGAEPSYMLGRGFTGHEWLPHAGVWNANARLYDPLLGRFLSPDPFVQDPALTQNYNRFAYALNCPLKYTDPSGMLFGIDDFAFALRYE